MGWHILGWRLQSLGFYFSATNTATFGTVALIHFYPEIVPSCRM